MSEREPNRPDILLDALEQRHLLEVARRAIEACLTESPPPRSTDPPSGLRLPRGAFVTLRRGGELRGCIGVVEAEQPLVDAVSRCALAAATEDPRFPPIVMDEMPEITIEISVLGPLFMVRDPVEIEIGRHGLVVSQGNRRGLLLPQVAIEHAWDVQTFLQETCRKAGLDRRAWQRGAVIEAFSAQVFSDPQAISGPRPGSPR